MNNRSKIFIVEDHPIFREGLIKLIDNELDLSVCGDAEDSATALSKISDSNPTLAIVDLTLKNGSGIDLIKDLKLKFPEILILVLSMHDEKIYAERSFKAGARGYIMKQEAPDTVITAIKQLLNGNIFASEYITNRLFNNLYNKKSNQDKTPIETLTDRELEIFQHIGKGLAIKEIARSLNISIKTVENHKANIKNRLNLKSSIELIQKATLWIEKYSKT